MTTSALPRRIRLSRASGWRKPAGAVVVARPTRWGNPFDWRDHGHAEAVRRYAAWMAGIGADEQTDRAGRRYTRPARLAELATLAGRPLACWCPLDRPCHADVLAELARRASEPGDQEPRASAGVGSATTG
ncbi:DUF4326 domain-containing protein [Frankia sp. Cas3]|uniref:DUF4326 domain-containing protein n=1 Tax=Frankia sp. Cas3 TaxID=3073926 RepID=UPI002AD4E93F|nr:DUF4326 domain-containing protein [Frankia sp. Cas3]